MEKGRENSRMKEKYCIFYESHHPSFWLDSIELEEKERERERENEKKKKKGRGRKRVLNHGNEEEENIESVLAGSKLNECVPRNTKDFHGTLLHRSRGDFGGARPALSFEFLALPFQRRSFRMVERES